MKNHELIPHQIFYITKHIDITESITVRITVYITVHRAVKTSQYYCTRSGQAESQHLWFKSESSDCLLRQTVHWVDEFHVFIAEKRESADAEQRVKRIDLSNAAITYCQYNESVYRKAQFTTRINTIQ